MILKFQEWLLDKYGVILESLIAPGLTPQEAQDLNGLDRMSSAQQADLDINLHKHALQDPSDRFSDGDDQELAVDMATKEKFKQIVTSNNPNPQEIQEVILNLKRNIGIHRAYLNRPEAENTGSHGWHRTWINVYQNWIAELNQRSNG